MPLYEYQCRQCGRRIEVLQRHSDPPPASCETCGGELKRLVSAPAFHLKGTGWYATDYARGGKDAGDKPAEGEKGGGAEAPAGGEGAKPAAEGAKSGDSAGKSPGTSGDSSPGSPAKPPA